MKLTLDHTQRLNLHALLGAQRVDVGSIRAIWAIQDRIELDADEERAIDLRHETIAGHERPVWNMDLSIPLRDFEFTEAEVVRMRSAVESWTAYGGSDRAWLEPLLDALFATDVRV